MASIRDLGLTEVGEADLSAPEWSFDLIGAWKDANGGIYISTDSGCSCPTPWENHGQLDDFTGPLTKAQAIEEATSLWKGDRDFGYDSAGFANFVADINAA